MDNKANIFQITLIAIFTVSIVAGVIVFSKARSTPKTVFPEVTLWGTLSKEDFGNVYTEINSARAKSDGELKVTYVEKRREDFDHDLIEALASGIGPDAIIISQDQITRYKDKLYLIPFESLSLRDFKDTYIDEAELYVDEGKGIVGLPFYVDPLVMYWNKDIFKNAGIVTPPKLWTEFFTLTDLLNKKDENNNITRSTIALGEFGNVTNAKEILSALFLQAGTPITRTENGILKSALNDSAAAFSPVSSVVSFYTEFSNPAKTSYSWNRAMPESKDLFLAGDLAVYIGFASEFSDLKEKNPNLNFDVAPLPQPKDVKTKTTYGRLYAFVALKAGKKISGTFQTLNALSSKDFVSAWVKSQKVAPPQRDLLSEKIDDPDLNVFYDSAKIASAWTDPDIAGTSLIFKNLIESISSGRLRIGEAVSKASQELDSLIRNK